MVDLVPRLISNDELGPAHLPPADADWPAIAAFALTFDGYWFWNTYPVRLDMPYVLSAETLTELRTRSFLEHRRWHHYGAVPDEAAMDYLHEVLAEIRRRLPAREDAPRPAV
jgi:hypothetical protein